MDLITKKSKEVTFALYLLIEVNRFYCRLFKADWAAANLATGTRNGEQLT